jgi:hypothetical protein
MNYNNKMTILFAAFLLIAGPARAADPKPDAPVAAADEQTVKIATLFLKADLSDIDPRLVEPFLAIKIESLPVKIQKKVLAKQVEVAALVRIHDTKKKGIFVQPTEDCDAKSFIKPLTMAPYFPEPGYEVVTDDELKCVMDQTKCTEIDLGCRFSMLIFYQKAKDRIVKFNANDPIMALVAGCRGKAGTTHFFGMSYTCMH